MPGPTGLPTAFSPVFGKATFAGWCTSAAIAGARMASAIITRMTIMDATATLSLRSRRQVSCHWLRPSTTCSGALSTAAAWNWISVILMGLPPGSGFGGEVLARLDREVAGGQVGGRVACLDL